MGVGPSREGRGDVAPKGGATSYGTMVTIDAGSSASYNTTGEKSPRSSTVFLTRTPS